MAYATQSDLEKQLPLKELVELTDDAGSGSVDAAVITDALNGASATVDSYAGARYKIPLQTSEKIKQVTVDLALYELFRRRRQLDDAIVAAHEAALKFLRDVSKGLVVLDQPAGQDAQATTASVKTPDRTDTDDQLAFGPKKMKDF